MFFIIFGTRGITRTISEGVFRCPSCRQDKAYALKSVRRWFTLFFIPVIPLDALEEFIECQSCQSTYNDQVLSIPTDAQFRAMSDDIIRRLIVGIVRADGQIAQAETEYAVALARPLLQSNYTTEDFVTDAKTLADQDMLPALRRFAGVTNEHGKARVLEVATLLSASDGEIHDTEVRLIHDIADALGVPRSYVPGIMQEALSSAARRSELNADTPDTAC